MALVAAGLAVAAGTVGDRAVLVGMLAVAGAGLGLFIPANNATVAGAGRPQQAGMVSGVLNMTRGVGTALGVAVAAASFALAAGVTGPVVSAAADHGFRLTLLILAAVAIAAAGLSLRNHDLRLLSRT